jgi:KUP system potassium uptake protein
MQQHHKVTAGALLVALGIIYGDIGTSPLYVVKALVGERQLSPELLLGGLSCVIWTITFQTTFKYIYLTLQADNNGEGGIFSLYALVRRYSKYLIFPTIIGACTLLADGIITPPISVASAVEGLSNIPELGHLSTVPIVIAILSALFFFQRFGTHKVGIAFGPIMLIWFSMLAVLGLSQIPSNPQVLQAINPMYAFNFLREYPEAFIMLGAVFLATTGAEALYSDLGHCGRRNIRITWGFVKVALLLNYMGQISWLLEQPAAYQLNGANPFFEIMPEWFLLPGILIATMAAIIASQALISGSYTLINEAINLNFWPRVQIKQPSDVKGQIYIPSINIMLWLGCIGIVLFFQNSANMEGAYGLAITITMMVTTFLLTFFLMYKLKWSKLLVFPLIALFATIEISFLFANAHKFPEGGYVTILVSSVFFFIMYSIYKGRKITNRFTRYVDLGIYARKIKELSNDETINKTAAHLVYLTKANNRHEIEEKIIKSIFAKNPKRADVYWFVHINRMNEPYTLTYQVSELLDDKIIKVTINVGFRIQPKTELYFKKIISELVQNKELDGKLLAGNKSHYSGEPDILFIVIEKFLSVENEFNLHDSIILNSYFGLKKVGLSDSKAFGIDKNDVIIENVPLVYHAGNIGELTRQD